MRDDDADRHTRPRVLTFLLAVIFLVVVGVPAGMVGNLYAHLDALSEDVRSGQTDAVGAELDVLRGFYDNSRAWGVQWLGDYLLADAFLERAAHAYLVKDYHDVVETLPGRVDDPRAAYLLGCARFRLAAGRYAGITTGDARGAAQKAAVIQDIIQTVNPDFERSVRADTLGTFAYKWNYDLTGDADALKRALEAPPVESDDDPPEAVGIGTPMRRRRG